MSFPFSTKSPIFVYDVDIPDRRQPFDAPLERLHAYMASQEEALRDYAHANGILHRTRVYHDLAFPREEVWGWCWPPGADNPTSVGPWLVWGIRHWTKRVPTRLMKAMLAERQAEWMREHQGGCPKSVTEELAKNITLQLLRAQLPEVGDFPFVYNAARRLLIVPGLADKKRETVLKRAHALLTAVIHPQARLIPWSLEQHLVQSRPGAVLPAEVDTRWLAFLAELAAGEAEVRFDPTCVSCFPDRPYVIDLHLDDRVRLPTGEVGETVTADGGDACGDAIRWAQDRGPLRVSELTLTCTRQIIREDAPDGSVIFAIRLDAQGQIRGCSFEGDVPKYSAKASGDLEAATLDRAELMLEAAELVRGLMHAFDSGPLQDLMETMPQTQLWPGQVAPAVSWRLCVDEGEGPDEEEKEEGDAVEERAPRPRPPTPLERSARELLGGIMDAVGPGGLLTATTSTRSVTVTHEQAERGVEAIDRATKGATKGKRGKASKGSEAST